MSKYSIGDSVQAEFKVVDKCVDIVKLTVKTVDLNADGEVGTFYMLKHSNELDIYLEETEIQDAQV